MEVHFQIGKLGDTVYRSVEFCFFCLERVQAEVIVHDETEPKSQPADFNRLLLNVHPKQAVLYNFLLGCLEPRRSFLTNRVHVTIGYSLQNPSKVHQFV